MNVILKWTLNALIGSFAGIFSIAASLSYELFERDLFVRLFTIGKTIGSSLYWVAVIIMLINTLRKVSDGDDFHFSEIFFRLVIGATVVTYGSDFFLLLYKAILEFSSKLIQLIANLSIDDSIFMKFHTDLTDLMAAILIGIAVYHAIKTIFSLGERFWFVFVSLIMMYVYNFQYVVGNDESMTSWIKQFLAISLTQIFQSLLLTTSLSLFVTSGNDVGMFVIAICGITAASNVEKILDRFAITSGGKYGNVARNTLSTGYYVKMLSSSVAKAKVPVK